LNRGACTALVVVLLMACGQLLSGGPARSSEDAVREAGAGPATAIPVEVPASAKEMFSGVGDAFVENLGQLEDRGIRYFTRGGGVSIGLTDGGIIVAMGGQAPDGPEGAALRPDGVAPSPATHLAVMFDGCREVTPRGRDAVDRTTNYLLGNDPSKWVRGARTFREVVYEGLWDGVDLVLRLKGDVLEYDIWSEKGADAGRVVFRYEGVEGLSVDGATGDLLVRTAAGELRDGRLVATSGREEGRSRDPQLMTGMLTAIQGFAKEGLERGGALRSISYEDNTILMASGERLYVATVVFGQPDDALRGVIEETVRELEAAYGDIIDAWDGDLSVFAGVVDVIRPIVERTRHVTREDVRAAGAAPGGGDGIDP